MLLALQPVGSTVTRAAEIGAFLPFPVCGVVENKAVGEKKSMKFRKLRKHVRGKAKRGGKGTFLYFVFKLIHSLL